jgi:hypothetical protein
MHYQAVQKLCTLRKAYCMSEKATDGEGVWMIKLISGDCTCRMYNWSLVTGLFIVYALCMWICTIDEGKIL